MKSIFQRFPISESEFQQLDKQYGKLCYKQAHMLYNANYRNNHTEDREDMFQEIKISMLHAGSYYKRQTYIENCLDLAEQHAEGEFEKLVLDELKTLWKNKAHHGASKQKFGPHQEKMLERFMRFVPKKDRPDKKAPLKMDGKFGSYCKSITWNRQRALGKKITREKPLRTGLASLSEFSYLGGKI